MNQICFEYCTRCQFKKEAVNDLLQELAYNEDRYLRDLAKKARQDPDSALHREAARQMAIRLDEDLEDGEPDDTEGMFQVDDGDESGTVPGSPGRRSEEITEEDIRKALEEYERNGFISIQEGKAIVTSKGVRKLAAGALERILKNLSRRNPGANPVKKLDFGIELSPNTRPYEVGDDYYSVDLERTALNAIHRSGELKFEPEDFEVREEINQAKLCAAIIIDESGSMRDSNKLEAAMETALALSKLILREPVSYTHLTLPTKRIV